MRLILALSCVVLVSSACSNTVRLSGARYGALPDSVEVQVIDGDGMTRAELQRALEAADIISRFSAFAETDEQLQARVDGDLERWKARAREIGGDAILYTRQSAVVAAIMQNTRYATPTGTVAIYILRSR